MKKGGCSCLRAPQLRKRPRPCPISGVCAKYVCNCNYNSLFNHQTFKSFAKNNNNVQCTYNVLAMYNCNVQQQISMRMLAYTCLCVRMFMLCYECACLCMFMLVYANLCLR